MSEAGAGTTVRYGLAAIIDTEVDGYDVRHLTSKAWVAIMVGYGLAAIIDTEVDGYEMEVKDLGGRYGPPDTHRMATSLGRVWRRWSGH